MKTKQILLLLFLSTFAVADNFPESLFNEDLSKLNKKIIIDLNELDEGGYLEVNALGRHIVVYRRTSKDFDYLSSNYESRVIDPKNKNWKQSLKHNSSTLNAVWRQVLLETQGNYEKIHSRSLLPDYMVIDSSSPTTCRVFNNANKESTITNESTFYDACSGKLYDSAGRLMKTNIIGDKVSSVNAFNLHIPPYTVLEPHKIEIGLHKAINFNHSEILEGLEYSGLTPNQRLWRAARNNDFINVKKAIAQGADPNKLEINSNALDYAILGSRQEVISYLISMGAKPTAATNEMIEIVGRDNIYEILDGSNMALPSQ